MESDAQYKLDILEAIERAQLSVAGLDYNAFMEDLDKFEANVRRLEIIGEAVKRLSAEFKAQMPQIPWKEIAGFRDKAIHDYASLNAAIVWETINKDLPILKKALS